MREKGFPQYLRACQKLFALDFETLEIVRISNKEIFLHTGANCCAILDSIPIDPRLRAFKSCLKYPTGFCLISLNHCVLLFLYFGFVVQKRNKQSGKILSLASYYNAEYFQPFIN
jgi:hypothetical protein